MLECRYHRHGILGVSERKRQNALTKTTTESMLNVLPRLNIILSRLYFVDGTKYDLHPSVGRVLFVIEIKFFLMEWYMLKVPSVNSQSENEVTTISSESDE